MCRNCEVGSNDLLVYRLQKLDVRLFYMLYQIWCLPVQNNSTPRLLLEHYLKCLNTHIQSVTTEHFAEKKSLHFGKYLRHACIILVISSIITRYAVPVALQPETLSGFHGRLGTLPLLRQDCAEVKHKCQLE